MDEKEVQHILIEILYTAVNELENNESIKEKITPDILPAVYRLAKKHDLAHVVSTFVYKNKIEIDQELQARLQREEIMSVYRNEQMKYSFGEICATFDEMGIAYVPLKGSVIRPYYPYESMRTSCDIDVLVREEDLDRAILALCEKLGYQGDGKKNYHDVSLFSRGGVHLELHFNICEGMENIDAMLSRVWEFVVPDGENGFRCRQTAEFFVFHHLAHMSYHFTRGGCGIKPFVDLQIIESKMEYDREIVRSWCRASGIEAFYDGALELTRAWMGGEKHTERSELMEEYILKGGVYGTLENMVSKQRVQRGGHKRYVLSRIFMPYDLLKTVYPVLEKHKWLTPLMQVRRWFRILFRGGLKRGAREWSASQSVTHEQEKKMKALMEQLGL